MIFLDIIKLFKKNKIYLNHNCKYENELKIEDIMIHSNEKIEKSIFFIKKGYNSDGMDFIEQAHKNGAILFISERNLIKEYDNIIVNDIIKAQNILSKEIYNSPSYRILLTGITGTNGKTTCAHLYQQFMEFLGKKCGRSGTIDVDIISKKIISNNTFPEGPLYRRFLNLSIKNGANAFVSEVSSHAIYLKRCEALDFDIKVFTNLTRDHIDFHKTMENYFKEKKRFMLEDHSSKLVINIDDIYGKNIYDEISKNKVITVGKNIESDLCILKFNDDGDRSFLKFRFKKKEYNVYYNLSGEFNCYNLLCVIGALIFSGFDIEDIISKIDKIISVPGRMEKISFKNVNAIVDYAHTPDALQRALNAIKGNQNIITVFGCGGNRDSGKRKIMGKTASDNSDIVIVTNDNPRNENPENIVNDIIEGITKNNYTVILDREKAIKHALDLACKDGGTVLIAGKGHETYQEIAGKKRFFSDLAVVKEYADKH